MNSNKHPHISNISDESEDGLAEYMPQLPIAQKTIKPQFKIPTFSKNDQKKIIIGAVKKPLPSIKQTNQSKPVKNTRDTYKQYLSLIAINQFKKENFTLTHDTSKIFIMSLPEYNYTPDNKSRLVFQTDFMDLYYTDPVTHKSMCYINYKNLHPKNADIKEKLCKIKIDHKLFPQSFLDFLIFYDSQIKQLYYPKYNGTYLLSNKNNNGANDVNLMCEMNLITGKISKDYEFSKYNKIVTYNISKKYPKKEEYDLLTLSNIEIENTLKKIFNDKKQIRLIVTPITWHAGGSFGSYLKIIAMEVKYKNANIESVFDQDEIDVQNEIGIISV